MKKFILFLPFLLFSKDLSISDINESKLNLRINESFDKIVISSRYSIYKKDNYYLYLILWHTEQLTSEKQFESTNKITLNFSKKF